MAKRDIFTKEDDEFYKSFLKAIEYIKELEDKQNGIEYFETMMRYIFNARKDLTKETANKLQKELKNNYPEGSDLIMTLAEILRKEGREEGIEKGRKEGREEEKIDMAIKLLTKKLGLLPEDLKEGIRQLDSPTLEVIIDGIFEIDSIDYLKKYLP